MEGAWKARLNQPPAGAAAERTARHEGRSFPNSGVAEWGAERKALPASTPATLSA